MAFHCMPQPFYPARQRTRTVGYLYFRWFRQDFCNGAMTERSNNNRENGRLSVSVIDGIAGLELYSAEIDRLNLVAVRPNPFLSSAYLRCYAVWAEYYLPNNDERLFLVWDAGRLIGCLPMRRSTDAFGPGLGTLRLKGVRLQFLAPLDIEEPGVLCAPEDEARVATVLVSHICQHERDWGMCEFAGQRPGGVLHRAVHAATGQRYRARDISVEPYNAIPLQWNDLLSYFRSLSQKMRSNIGRQARHLYAAGNVQLILAEGQDAVTAWFEAYCDLDSRSWKRGTAASIQRHPRRVRYYRELMAGQAGFDPSFIGVVLDGALIAGLLIGGNKSASPQRHSAWCLEMAYDESKTDLGPGQLLFLLAVGAALERSDEYVSFMQNFAYYKHRWGAVSIEVINLQLIRRISLHNARASLGDLRKWWIGKQASKAHDKAVHKKPEIEPNEQGSSSPASHLERARQLTAAALAYTGPGTRVLTREESRNYLPFDLDS
jgi:hypothetical protein